MGFRTVIIRDKCKLKYKDGYLIVRNDQINMIHLSEINTLMIDSTMVTITTYLISELLNKKIKVIFCDQKRNPIGEIVQYYGAHNSSKRISLQISWDQNIKCILWKNLIKQKIFYQADVLKRCNNDNYKTLMEYYESVKENDSTNREGHAAKVYFNSLFGKDFSREYDNSINAALDYGYSILLSAFNKAIVSKGYLTQLGIFHRNEFNPFNLSCDLMEPFRPIVDYYVYKNKERVFDKEYRLDLINLLNKKVVYNKKSYYLNDCIPRYTNNVLEYLSQGQIRNKNFLYYYEL